MLAASEVFPSTWSGNGGRMIALGLALIGVGVVFLFFLPWVGIPLGIIGLMLLAFFLFGMATKRRSPR
jgi:Flp pilus assembly protein TadB